MVTPLRIASLTLATLAVAVALSARSDPVRHGTALRADVGVAFSDAARLFRAQQYPEAYGRFVKLANHGHAQAAQMALMMYANGATVFGSDWDANPEQLQQWKTLAAGGAPALRTAKIATVVR